MPLHLRKRGGVWHYSRTVPPDVRGVVGQPYWRYSLKTSSLREAELLRAESDIRHQREIDQARALHGIDRMRAIKSKLPPGERRAASTSIKAAIRILESVTVEDTRSKWTLSEHRGRTPEARDDYDRAEDEALRRAALLVAALGDDERAAIDKAGGVEAFYRGARAERVRLNAQTAFNPEPRSEDAADLREVRTTRLHRKERTLDALRLLPDTPPEVPETTDNPRILTALDAFLAENKQQPPTVKKYRLHMRRLTEFVGNVTVKTLTPAMVAAFVKAYGELPNARSVPLALRSAPMRELIAYKAANPDCLPYGDGNLLKMTDYLRAFFKWLNRSDLKDAVRRPKIHPDEKTKVEPLSPADLRRVLAEVEKRSGRDSDDTWWVYVMAFTGFRPEEAAQLDRSNVRIGSQLAAFEVKRGNNRRIKNNNSVRTIPVHPVLIERGFLKFVEGKTGKLFESFKPGSGGRFSSSPSKRLKSVLNALDVRDNKSCAQRFRHAFTDAMRNAELPYSTELAFVGHADQNKIHGGYGAGTGFKTLARVVGRIDPRLDVLDDESLGGGSGSSLTDSIQPDDDGEQQDAQQRRVDNSNHDE